MRTIQTITTIIAMTSFAAACGPSDEDGLVGDDSNGTGIDGGTTPPVDYPDAGPVAACDKMDIVFVVDNSGSMMQEQVNLAANFPMFIDVLDGFTAKNGEPIDYRVAVTSTGLDKSWTETVLGIPSPASQKGDNGELLQRCSMPRRWLERADTDLATTFACAAELGTSGPGLEMPLEALKMALGARVQDGTNAGFLREDALLAVVILTDEDDCSRAASGFNVSFGLLDTPEQIDKAMCAGSDTVASYKQFFDTTAGGEGRWAVATIAGPGPGVCESTFGNATEATRLREFTGLAGSNGVFSSICDGDIATSLQAALETFDSACQQLPPIE